MSCTRPPRTSERGFTIIELMITFATVGALVAIAIPLFYRYQYNSKSAEAKSNLGSLRVAEEAYFSETGFYIAAAAEPPLIPGTRQEDFDPAAAGYATVGWRPEGRVYFSYAVLVSADQVGFTADAGADIDGNGIVQLWGYSKPDAAGVMLDGDIGCDVSFLSSSVVGRCSLDNSIF